MARRSGSDRLDGLLSELVPRQRRGASRRRQGLLALGGGLLGTLALAVGAGLYGSSQVVRPPRSELQANPADWGLAPEPLRFPSPDGIPLDAWLLRSPTARASVVLVHGYGASKEFAYPVAAMLWPRFHILALDLRAHGQSGGQVTSVGFTERQDVIAAVDEAARRLDAPVGVLGISMGAVAALLAAADCPRIAAVAADSPFATLRGVIARAACQRGYPGPITPLLAELTCRAIALQQRYPVRAADPIRVIGSISPRPVFLAHGGADELCTPDNTERLYAAAREPKELWIAPGVAHAMLYQDRPDEYRARMAAFFSRWLE